MSISTVESISINGSQNFLGGQIYDLKFSRGFNGQPSTVDASIVAESRKYETPYLNYTSPYHIDIGGVYQFDFFAYKYCISDGTQGRLLNVSFKDGVNKLSRYWIAPVGQVCSHPNVIFIGTIPNNGGFATNQAQGVNQTTSFTINPTQTFLLPGEKSVPFGSYNYEEFQKGTAFLGIPLIKSNNFVRITQEGTVLDVFNYFMNLYGYSWYIDAGQIKLIDLKRPVVIDSSLINTLETHARRLSSNLCVSNDNNFVRGAVALEDTDNSNDSSDGSYVLTAAQALWNGADAVETQSFNLDGKSSDVNFLGVPLLAGYGGKAALYAYHSQQLYFAYIFSKHGLEAALQAIGLVTYDSFKLTDVPSTELQNNQFLDSSAPFDSNSATDVQVYTTTSVTQDGVQSFYERDKLLGEILVKGYYTIQDVNPSVQWALGSPTALNQNTKCSEIQQLNGLIFDDATIGSKTSQNVWLLSFPTAIDFSGLNETFLAKVNNFFPQKIPFSAKALGKDDAQFSIVRVDTKDKDTIKNIPNLTYDTSSTRYIQGNLNSADIRLGNITQKEIPIYGLGGRRILACNIPPVFPETSNLDIVTFENIQDEVPNVKAFVAQNAYSKNNPDVQYEVNVRGINLGFIITPEQGLEGINVSLDENGYNTSYHLSSNREVPPNPESLRGLKQFSPIT